MKRSTWVCMFVFAAACGVSSPADPRGELSVDSLEQESVISKGAGSAEAALLAAAATGDPQIMAQAAASASCHASMTCAGFGSCGTWSAAAACGTQACGSATCGPRCDPARDPSCTVMHPLVQHYERYRVCQNQLAQSCVEWAAAASVNTCNESCSIVVVPID